MSDHHHPKAKIHGSLACLGDLCAFQQATEKGVETSLLYQSDYLALAERRLGEIHGVYPGIFGTHFYPKPIFKLISLFC